MRIHNLSKTSTYTVKFTSEFGIEDLCSSVHGDEIADRILPIIANEHRHGEIHIYDDQHGYLAVKIDNHNLIMNGNYSRFGETVKSLLLEYTNRIFKFNPTVEYQ